MTSAGDKAQNASQQNVISRLESKYSDILDRVAKRKEKQRQEQQQHDDRDKTLEPDDVRMPHRLMKSATTANISKSSYGGHQQQKERTPFKIERNKNKYNNGDKDYDSMAGGSGGSSSANNNNTKIKRSDILGTTSTSNDYSTYSKLKSHDSGYYDGSYYKSKYDDLLSDVSTNRHTPRKTSAVAYTGSSSTTASTAATRQLKPYKRSDGTNDKHRTAINLYDMLDNEPSSSSSSSNYRRQYSQRKSTGKPLRTYNDNNHNISSSTDESGDDFSDFEKTERENRRKEIQSLIMKYAQLDDFYSKTSAPHKEDINNNNSKNIDPWDMKMSPVVIPLKSTNKQSSSSNSSSQFNALGKSKTMANISSFQSNYDYDYDTSWYGSNYSSSKNKSSNVVPITTYAPKSSSKSRMSKALSTFVRKKIELLFFFVAMIEKI